MRSILFVGALLAALPSHGILIRADRDDAEYIELATRYPAAIEIAPGIEGVLIAPRWMLTSARSATLLLATRPPPPIEIAGKRNAIVQTFLHPAWKQGAEADLALLLLREAVPDIEPVAIYADRGEIDEVVFIVGHGETGNLGDAARRTDGRKRAAINTVDRVLAATLGLRLKAADSASDLQGGPASGERGAPALMESMGKTHVVGIFSATDGEWQVFARVSSHAQWIADTMFRAGIGEAAKVK